MSAQNLLKTRRFAPLFFTQFFGAFNDNLYKNALILLLTFQSAQWSALSSGFLTNLAMALFILPFFLFSATSGLMADKYDKARLARISKALEILIVLVAGAGFAAESLKLLLTALFLLGLQSTLFGPVKYAILPQHLAANELVRGNALVEAATFVAILLGTLAGGLLAATENGALWITLASLAIALLGYAASRAIPPAPAPDPGLRLDFNPITTTWHCIGFARENRRVFLAVLGISWFWLYGSLLLTQFPALTQTVLGGSEHLATVLLAVFAVGVGAGSLLCGKLARERADVRLTLTGAIGLTLFGLDLAWIAAGTPLAAAPLAQLLAEPRVWRVLFDLLLLGASGGLYGVPLYTLMQQESHPGHRARVIAANNILNALFMTLAALFAMEMLAQGATLAHLIAAVALANIAVIALCARLLRQRQSDEMPETADKRCS
ncbi:MAG: MFS transporter [Zoogloeaceae bacterium]|jgi:MFS family permease|nr:MFS transporter [Zoogloeaceae bacterium]